MGTVNKVWSDGPQAVAQIPMQIPEKWALILSVNQATLLLQD